MLKNGNNNNHVEILSLERNISIKSRTSNMSQMTTPTIQEMIDSLLALVIKAHKKKIEEIKLHTTKIQEELKIFKESAISKLITTLIDKEAFVIKVQFKKIETAIQSSIQSLLTLQDIKTILCSTPKASSLD